MRLSQRLRVFILLKFIALLTCLETRRKAINRNSSRSSAMLIRWLDLGVPNGIIVDVPVASRALDSVSLLSLKSIKDELIRGTVSLERKLKVELFAMFGYLAMYRGPVCTVDRMHNGGKRVNSHRSSLQT